jgi:kynurenine formamidase
MPTIEEFRALSKRLSNWGRWGPVDQRGALNFITSEVLRRAGASVVQGKIFSLGLEFNSRGLLTGRIGQEETEHFGKTAPRFNPIHTMTSINLRLGNAELRFGVADDVIHMPLQCSTQWDGLAHVHYEGMLYNGYKVDDVLSMSDGAAKLGVEHMAQPGILSRGVLLDIARLKGVDRLDDGAPITPGDLDAAMRRQAVTLESGDVALIRTGYIDPFAVRGDRACLYAPQPGLTMDCAEWIHAHELAAIAADNGAVEQMPSDPNLPNPLHMLCIRDMGCVFGEFFNLAALAEDCAKDGQYTFLLAANALGVTGGCGSPVNPLAVK